MGRPETWTALVVVVFGLGIALLLAAKRPPETPLPPSEPVAAMAELTKDKPGPKREIWKEVADPADGLGKDGLACGPKLDLEALGDGRVRLAVDAPCRVGEGVLIDYGPMTFGAEITERGTYREILPAFSTPASVAFATDDTTLLASLDSSSAPMLLGVSWTGESDFDLSVSEYGQDVTLERPGLGRILSLGKAPGPRSVLYMPPEEMPSGTIRIEVDVRADPGDCGTTLLLLPFDTLSGNLASRSVDLILPDCPQTGLRFSMKDLLDDLRSTGN